ncbi:MAG TPA: beta-L-arabinofuranosidase domain-containing protein [Phnomibacter sp.]|nr:beta-L-arabinofuranosidase domain-containing protein [Phnomibacter sp.]
MKKIQSCLLFVFCATASFAQSLEIANYPIQKIDLRNVQLTDKFWLPRIQQIQQVTIPFAFGKCEAEGRFENFVTAEKAMKGEPGKVRGKMPFDDTDPYKIIEGASLTLVSSPNEKLSVLIDQYIGIIAKGQEPDGYLTTWRTINPAEPPATWVGKCKQRWDNLQMSHELYNSGHMFEAAATHYYATGKKNFLNIALKNADLLVKVFGAADNYDVPGHEIVETGLIKLYLITGKKAYYDLSKKFIDLRGTSEHRKPRGAYWQDYKPVAEQDEVVGHAVRAVYYYAGITDVAAISGEEKYDHAIHRLWNNMVHQKMYVTGGVGARHSGEAFGDNYELPNLSAYNETCAAIGGVMWADRMFRSFGDGEYYNVLERMLYNGVLPGISLDGKAFFYPNPLESDSVYKFNQGHLTRAGWFDCPCCPTNMIRFLPSIPALIYDADKEGMYVNLYVANKAHFPVKGTEVHVVQATDYPVSGGIQMQIDPAKPTSFLLRLRVPDWATDKHVSGLYSFENKMAAPITVLVNGKKVTTKVQKGYIEIKREWKKGDKVALSLPMQVRTVAASPLVKDDSAKISLQYGPLMYCMEKIDNNTSFDQPFNAAQFKVQYNPAKLGGINELFVTGSNSPTWNFIPYYAWSNRGAGKMKVWVKKD